MLATRIQAENFMLEEQVAKVESDVTHLREDIQEIKMDVRRLDDKIDDVKAAVFNLALSTEKGFASLTRWGIGLYIGLIAGLAMGFMWVAERLPPP